MRTARVTAPLSLGVRRGMTEVRGQIGWQAFVESAIVVVILCVLGALVAPQFSAASIDRTEPETASTARRIESQIELYRSRYGTFPPLSLMTRGPGDSSRGASFGILIDEGFIESAPVNPFTGGTTIPRDWVYDDTSGRLTPMR